MLLCDDITSRRQYNSHTDDFEKAQSAHSEDNDLDLSLQKMAVHINAVSKLVFEITYRRAYGNSTQYPVSDLYVSIPVCAYYNVRYCARVQ